MKNNYLLLTKSILILILFTLLVRLSIINMIFSNTQTLSNTIKNSFALEPDTHILIQLVTPDGYEIDYTTEMLAHPD